MKTKYKVLSAVFFLLFISAIRISYLPTGNQKSPHQTKQNGYYDYQGVIHFNTNYSDDANGTFEEIAEVADQQKVDFMISTDHDTLKPLEDKKEGWHKNTLFLAGEEIRVTDGHILTFGIQHLSITPHERTEDVISDIVNQGGLAIIAHTNHPSSNWKWQGENDYGITGAEILDLADQVAIAPVFSKIKAMIFYPFNPSAAFMELYTKPAETLKWWDKRTRNKNMVGIYAPDFHQAVRITRQYKYPFPRADKILPIAHDHVIMQKPFSGNFSEDKKTLYDAIKRGHLYVSMDILGNASGFLFSAKQGNKTFWMGDQLQAGHPTSFSVTLPPTADSKQPLIHLYRDGEEIIQSHDGKLNYQTDNAGIYRVEVEVATSTFLGFSKKVVWIYSNPIYLR